VPPRKRKPATPASKTREIADVVAEETSDARIPGGKGRHWTADALSVASRRGRHDQRYVPRGHQLIGDRLYRREPKVPPMTPDDRELVEAGIELLQYFLENEDEFTPEVRAACSAIFESAHGHPPDESWRRELANLLREQAQRREQARITAARVTWPPDRTPAQVLELVRERTRGETVPEYLTCAVIAQALDMVNLGGGGGRGKRGGRTPEQCVNWIVQQVRRAVRKPRD
jgi:hypothetical protein